MLLNTTYTNPLRTMVGAPLFLALQKVVVEPVLHLTAWLSPVVVLSKWQSYLSGSTHLAMRTGFGWSVTRSQLGHVSRLSTVALPAVEARGNLAMMNWDATAALAGLAKPLLVVGADMDIVTKLKASETIARASGGVLQVVTGANHLGPVECAERYNALIAAFAQFCEDGAAS